MRIAIPSNGPKGLKETVAEHFGRCPFYTILDEKGLFLELLENTGSHMGGQVLPPQLLKQNNIDILLCQGIGPKAIELCQNLNIDVYVSFSSTVEELFRKWQQQNLKKASLDDSCKEHKT